MDITTLIIILVCSFVISLIYMVLSEMNEKKEREERIQLHDTLQQLIDSHKDCNNSIQRLLKLMEKSYYSDPDINVEYPKNYDINKLFEDE